ncbi:protein phosphatase 2C domain-containing protein [Halobacillus litoralis]|uniref:protein phosphatase 2C domain-containing protein n=1 Tax=Halobacillus litoralis TaxID=45668 RepID=UPI001CD5F7FE|nr:protein phosphatase 2C domain-containing protein [Halobacillus litoralis]MCA0969307.1 protein phosphatase 2C domain-containing protein [Halobacillus litoralis]
MNERCWLGEDAPFIDRVFVESPANRVTIGRFGGDSNEGQTKNEDGCLVWWDQDKDWEFAVLLDAHDTAQSAQLVLNYIKNAEDDLKDLFRMDTGQAFNELEVYVLSMFKSERFRNACETIQGETSCVLVFRKDHYLWWFSVGDCILHLYHDELAEWGEFQQNHRSFYEWIGENSTFNRSIPCYSTGRKELRQGQNIICLTTDGLLESKQLSYQNPVLIFDRLRTNGIQAVVLSKPCSDF